jgi:putative DNA primase/helicase
LTTDANDVVLDGHHDVLKELADSADLPDWVMEGGLAEVRGLVDCACGSGGRNVPGTVDSPTVKGVAAAFDESADMLGETPTSPGSGKKKTKLSHQSFADLIYIQQFDQWKDVIFDENRFWRWSGSLWFVLPQTAIRQMIVEIGRLNDRDFTGGEVGSVLKLFQAVSYRDGVKMGSSSLEFINCCNGELHFDWKTKAFVLRPHERGNYSITQVNALYDPDASCPRFERYLLGVFRDDPDRDAKCYFIFQIIGYCCLPSCRFERFFVFFGSGANGKSVLLWVIREIVGALNTASVQPSQFDNKFQIAHLHGKLLNLITDLDKRSEIPDGALKRITSGEPVTAEHKNQNPFTMESVATLLIAANHLPTARDHSNGMFRRSTIIPFNRTFSESEQDRWLKEDLSKELTGIFTRAVTALEDAFVNNGFSIPASCIEAHREWMADIDQVSQFVDEMCFLAPSSYIKSADLYKTYQGWSAEAGISNRLNRKNFTIRLRDFGVKPGKGKNGVRLIHGIGLEPIRI